MPSFPGESIAPITEAHSDHEIPPKSVVEQCFLKRRPDHLKVFFQVLSAISSRKQADFVRPENVDLQYITLGRHTVGAHFVLNTSVCLRSTPLALSAIITISLNAPTIQPGSNGRLHNQDCIAPFSRCSRLSYLTLGGHVGQFHRVPLPVNAAGCFLRAYRSRIVCLVKC